MKNFEDTMKEEMKTKFVYFDLCFYEYCNLKCTYCRNSNNKYKKNFDEKDIQITINNFLLNNSALILKLSGYGEVSIWPYLIDIVKNNENSFPIIQIMTNGLIKNDIFDELNCIRNVCFCVTIDGHTVDSNFYRCKGNREIHNKMIDFLNKVAIKNNQPIDLNCVISDLNIKIFDDYIKYIFNEIGDNVTLFPFPVRKFDGLTQKYSAANYEDVKKCEISIMENYESYKKILPPKEYLERLFYFMLQRKRGWKCEIPKLNYSIGPNLLPLNCACLGHTKPSQYKKNTFDEVNEKQHKIIDGLRLINKKCLTCFTHYEILNLYFENKVSLDELSNLSCFKNKDIKNYLRVMKNS